MTTENEAMEPCHHPDFDWFNPYIDDDDPDNEVLACTECGWVRWTARDLKPRVAQ
jgi:hypothetical protein